MKRINFSTVFCLTYLFHLDPVCCSTVYLHRLQNTKSILFLNIEFQETFILDFENIINYFSLYNQLFLKHYIYIS